MEVLEGAVRWLQAAVFLLTGLWALRRSRGPGGAQSGWLAATFLTLSVTVTIGALLQSFPNEVLPGIVRRLSIAIVVPFPYLLLRFLETFEPVRRGLRRGMEVAVTLLLPLAFLLPTIPTADEPRTGLYALYVTVLVAVWLVVLPLVTVRFWRAGTGEPTIVRRRLRTLSWAAGSMSVAVLLAGADTSPGSAVTVVLQVVLLLSAGLFLVGFAPPGALKTLWRQPEERRLHEASLDLMAATDPEDVARLLAPHLRRVIAARAVAIVRADEVLASEGLSGGELAVLAAGEVSAGTTLPLASGAIHVWTGSYTPFFGEEELVLLARLGVLADLALDRASLFARERAARTELQAANEDLESFVYSASHDLKSPLIAVISYVDVLAEEYGHLLGEEGGWFLDRLRSNGQYMEALVTDLLELSRVGRVDAEVVDVNLDDLVREIGAELAHTHPGVAVAAAPLPVVRMNALRARQLFRNLVENAAVHGGDDRVRVEVATMAPPDGESGVVVLVRDDGAGVPARYRERVFGVFERLESDTDGRTGTGIGLAICRKIVESVGGRIWLTDHEGGAEFAVLLPAAVTTESDAGRVSREVPAWA